MTFDYAAFAAEFPWFFPVAVALFGAIVGSFLNVVIYRMPLDKSIVTPGSHCACGAPIKWYDNIPVLSWFLLRGKARCCGRSYSFRYAFVELLTAALFLACWLMFPPAKALCGMLFVSCILCAFFIDLDHMIIPDEFTIGLGVVGVVLSVFVPSLHNQSDELFIVGAMQSGLISFQGLLIGSGLVLWIALIAEALLKKEAMGFGDVKFVGAIGAFLGWQGAVFSIFGGAVVGTVWIGLAMVWKKLFGDKVQVAPRAETADGQPAELGMGAQIPFGPMLAIGALMHFFYFSAWMDDYLAEFAAMFH
ncbi:MAG: prepilin peptidase [Opitutaceae bacterium]|nr:prepilin peptidase [Opitutaceae bacterium]